MRRLIICIASFLSLSSFQFHLRAQTTIAPVAMPHTSVIPSTADLKTQLSWMQDYPAALKRAEAEKKPVLIDITTDWCGWSKKMDRETLTTPDVQEMLRRFVLVRLNPELSKENEKVSDDFGVTGFPHFVIVNYKGEDIGHLDGYSEKKEFVEFILKYEAPFKNSALGYRSVELPSSDDLFKAIKRIPPPESRPTSAGSFIILDQCEVRLESNGVAKFVSRTATYVADAEKKDLPTAEHYYNSSREQAKFKVVRVLDVSGRGRELEVALAKDEHAYDNQNVYWDARRLSLELPALKAGQILDVIEEQELQPIMPGQFYFRWETGPQMLLLSKFEVTFPAALKLQQRMVRCLGAVRETRNADGTLTWSLDTSHPEPYEPAPFSPPYHEFWEGCDFFTPCTKEDISSWYTDLCRGRDQLPEAARQKVIEIKQANKTQTAQLQAILNWVTTDIRYISVAFGLSSHQPHSATDTLQNAYGDCKDQSMLVLSLCHAAGIPANLVLVNAYGANINETNPAVAMFNHCIVEAQADGALYYLDPAAGEQALGRLPSLYAGTRALKIDGAKGAIITLPPFHPLADQSIDETLVKLNPNGSATVTQTWRYSGGAARYERQRLKGTTVSKLRSYLQDAYKKSGRKLLDVYLSDPEAEGSSYEMRISYTEPRFGSKGAGGLVFKLGDDDDTSSWMSLLNFPRKLPFRFYASDGSTHKLIVELPAGATLTGLPEMVQIDNHFLKATRKAEFTGHRLTVTETSSYLDARLPATEASQVSAAFQKLQDHRDYSYAVQLPAPPLDTAK